MINYRTKCNDQLSERMYILQLLYFHLLRDSTFLTKCFESRLLWETLRQLLFPSIPGTSVGPGFWFHVQHYFCHLKKKKCLKLSIFVEKQSLAWKNCYAEYWCQKARIIWALLVVDIWLHVFLKTVNKNAN